MTSEPIDLAALREQWTNPYAHSGGGQRVTVNLADAIAVLDRLAAAERALITARVVNRGRFEDSRMTVALDNYDRAIAGQQEGTT